VLLGLLVFSEVLLSFWWLVLGSFRHCFSLALVVLFLRGWLRATLFDAWDVPASFVLVLLLSEVFQCLVAEVLFSFCV
jgi:hypothetical protein